MPSLACFHLAEHISSLYCSGNLKATGFHLAAGSPVTVIVTFLLPAHRKGLCLIIMLRDGLCTLEPVGHRICRVCTRVFRIVRAAVVFFLCGTIAVQAQTNICILSAYTSSCLADLYFALWFMWNLLYVFKCLWVYQR